MNQIAEKYFTQGDFSRREREVLAAVTKRTGFVVEREIARGTIYDQRKVGSLIYRGTWRGKSAVLKLQGLRPEVDETKMMRCFTVQNQSQCIRVPRPYAHQPWTKARGYGYLITERIEGRKIFEMPFATSRQMREFARFYDEYRRHAVAIPWFKPETYDALAFTVRRVDHWRKISESKGRLALADYAPYLMRYYPIAIAYLPFTSMPFCHGHLSANDIYRMPDGTYVVLSNLYWSYRPRWYDLAFNIWACLQHIRDPKLPFSAVRRYVERWLRVYRTIPVTQEDRHFERNILVLLLERMIGAILVDLGANDVYAQAQNRKYFRHLLGLHQQLFDYFVRRLERFS